MAPGEAWSVRWTVAFVACVAMASVKLVEPPAYDSDHLMVIADMLSAPLQENKAYLGGRKAFPLRVCKRHLRQLTRPSTT
jgi:hypothetical protein